VHREEMLWPGRIMSGGQTKAPKPADLARSQRASKARDVGLSNVEGEMRSFLEAVLSVYEIHGVDELALSKIGGFLKVKYGGTNGAKRVLGEIP
jgi:type I restriction enzyme R subunit